MHGVEKYIYYIYIAFFFSNARFMFLSVFIALPLIQYARARNDTHSRGAQERKARG